MSLTEHWGVGIFGHQNRKLSFTDGVECLRCILKELDIFFDVELRTWSFDVAARAPSELLLTTKDNLDVDILVVNLESGCRARSQIQFRYIDKDIVAINVVTAYCERSNIGAVEPLECRLQARRERVVEFAVAKSV